MRSSRWLVGSVAFVLAAALGVLWVAGGRSEPRAHHVRASAAPAAEPTAFTTSLEIPATLGPGARIVFMGDSVGGDVARGLVPVAASRGAVVTPQTVPGCSNIRGLPVGADDQWLPWAPACLHHLETSWRAGVGATPANAVLWLSSFDASRRLIDGTIADPATPDGRARIAALILETADIVAPPGSGRRVVFLLPAPQSPSYKFGPPDPAAVSATAHHAAILHLVIAQDPTRFSMLRLSQYLCPAGAGWCPLELTPGFAPRGWDGRHLSPEGAAWLAPLILDALGV